MVMITLTITCNFTSIRILEKSGCRRRRSKRTPPASQTIDAVDRNELSSLFLSRAKRQRS
eukprot:scaffold3199_cov165-Amphora_coffeaeformis.AAC.8